MAERDVYEIAELWAEDSSDHFGPMARHILRTRAVVAAAETQEREGSKRFGDPDCKYLRACLSTNESVRAMRAQAKGDK